VHLSTAACLGCFARSPLDLNRTYIHRSANHRASTHAPPVGFCEIRAWMGSGEYLVAVAFRTVVVEHGHEPTPSGRADGSGHGKDGRREEGPLDSYSLERW
jgi:hypothetical protein